MIPPGNLEAARGFIVSTLQQCADFATAQTGYQPLTTFIGGVPSNGPVIQPGGLPQSAIMGRIPGLLISQLQEATNKIALLVCVDFYQLTVEDDQTAKVLFKPAHFYIRVYENPDINQAPPVGDNLSQGYGLPILFMVERIVANLKYIAIPGSIMTGDTTYSYVINMGNPRRSGNDKDAANGFDVWDCPGFCDVATPIRPNQSA